MEKYTKLTIWSERIITWVFAPALIGLFGLYFMGLQQFMIIPMAIAAAGACGLFIIYIWRFFVPW